MFNKTDSCAPEHFSPLTQGHCHIERRRFLQWLTAPAILALLPNPIWAANIRLAAARLWPSNEYTRITLETVEPITHHLRQLQHPDRLVIDLENFELSPALQKLSQRADSIHDRYLKDIRFGAPEPGKLRIVLDLNQPVRPQIFTLKPVANYQYRLVIDLYPVIPYDPLLAMVEQEALRSQVEKPSHQTSLASHTPKTSSHSKPDDETGPYQDDLTSLLAKEDRQDDLPSSDALPVKPSTVPASINRPSIHLPSSPPGLHKKSGTITIALDPGHGGEDPGAIGQQQTFEKNIVLSIGRKLRTMMEHHPNTRILMTRDDDYFVPLHQRVQKARRVKADLFVSIHADAFTKPSAKGSSVFILSEHGASSAAARWLAQNENSSDLVGGFQPHNIQDSTVTRLLLDMSQTATLQDSMKLARAVLKEMGEINTLHTPHVEEAGFAVLKAPDIPSILVETAFISNPEEEKELRDEGHQEKIAQAIAEGIKAYASKQPRLASIYENS